MAKLPYMPFYVGDYLADTQHLSTLQHGAYMLLIMAYWRRGKPLPDDDERLARIACMSTSEWNANAHAIREFFECDGTALVHHRIDTELAKVREKSEKAQKSAFKRWEGSERNANAMRTDVRSECYSDSDSYSDTKKDIVHEPKKEDAYLQDFDEAWEAYPRKEARKASYKCYLARRREGIEAGELLSAAKGYAKARKGQETKLIMLGTTFFGSNERWRDFVGKAVVTKTYSPPVCKVCATEPVAAWGDTCPKCK